MKFIVSSTALSSHLQAISRVINSKNALPILDCFLFELEDGTYYEAELCEYTEQNRTILLPKTKRGKPKKMNYTATLSFQPFWSLLQIFGQPNYHCQLHDPNHILPRRKSE